MSCGGCQVPLEHTSKATLVVCPVCQTRNPVIKSQRTDGMDLAAVVSSMCGEAVKDTMERTESLWNAVSDEVGTAVAMRRSGAERADSRTVGEALDRVCQALQSGDAQSLLSNLEPAGLSEFLPKAQELWSLEETLVVWRCLQTAIAEDDRLALETWLELAGQLTGLSMPVEVSRLVDQMRERERRALQGLERQQEVYRQISFALEAQDAVLLNDLLQVCLQERLDATPVRLAMQQLRSEPGQQSIGPGPPLPSERRRNSERTRRTSGATNDMGKTRADGSQAQFSGEETRARRASGNAGMTNWEREQQRHVEQARASEERRAQAEREKMEAEAEARRKADQAAEESRRRAAEAAEAKRRQEREEEKKKERRRKQEEEHKKPLDRAEALRVLGFDPRAFPTVEDLKKAYRSGALKYHPDRRHNHDDPEAAADMFRRVKASFDLLAA